MSSISLLVDDFSRFLSSKTYTQTACISGAAVGVGCVALGILGGRQSRSTLLALGASIGYMSYNSYQVLTNIKNYNEDALSSVADGLFSAASNAVNSAGSLNPVVNILDKNTVYFDWAIKLLLSKVGVTNLISATDNLEKSIEIGLEEAQTGITNLAEKAHLLAQKFIKS